MSPGIQKTVQTIGWMLLAALFSSGGVAALLTILFQRRAEEIKTELQRSLVVFQTELQKSLAVFQSGRTWEERAVSELLGPIWMQLDRTARAFGRWNQKNLFLEAKVIREGNLAIRELLLTKSDLIPPALRKDAGDLVEHYDRWLEAYERVRETEKPDLQTPFVFVGVGDDPYPFPHEAEVNFIEVFKEMWSKLYSEAETPIVDAARPST
jgi:hypothetical protein